MVRAAAVERNDAGFGMASEPLRSVIDAGSAAPKAAGAAAGAGAVAHPFKEEAGDARLVEAARRGDQDAFAALVHRYERKLVCVLARLVQNEELARDLAQETFWKVYSNLHRFDTSRRFGPWLFRVGVNLGVDALRRREVTMISLEVSGVRDAADRSSGAALDVRAREDLAQEVRHVLNQVPLADRTVMLLRDLEGFSSAEVAAIIGRRETTVRWRLARARDEFRRIWLERDGSAGGDVPNAHI